MKGRSKKTEVARPKRKHRKTIEGKRRAEGRRLKSVKIKPLEAANITKNK